MQVLRLRALRGPNLWSRQTAIEAVVSCDTPEPLPGGMPGFLDRLYARFPQIDLLPAASCPEAEMLAHALECAVLGLAIQVGCPVAFSKIAPTLEADVYQVVVEYSEEAVGRLAFDLAQDLCSAAIEDTPFNLADALQHLRELYEDIRLGPSTGSVVRAAVARGRDCSCPPARRTAGRLQDGG